MNSKDRLERTFRNLPGSEYSITSPMDKRYNCIAWAAGDDSKWWEPDIWGQCYWPEEVVRSYSLDAFKAVFELKGYEECENGNLEEGFEKVAIFARGSQFEHVAKQLDSGLWTSKLGDWEDIEHQLRSLEEGIYGNAIIFLKKPKKSSG